MAKVAVVVTILNEEKNLPALFSALEKQSRKPDEVIIVDGGSIDPSVKLLASWKPNFRFSWFVKRGNRSKGRNKGIEKAKSSLIAITDAGCCPDKNWLKYLVAPLEVGSCDVVSGYYTSRAKTAFEQAATAYMLVMPNQIDPDNFLPATRSMAMTRAVWKQVGGFPEKLSHNEDYVFAHKLKRNKSKIKFVKEASVEWFPPQNWNQFIKQIGRFSYGDAEAGIVRPKVVSIFLRWLIILSSLFFGLKIFTAILASYCLWAYLKSRNYVPSLAGARILPTMQVITDFIVMGCSLWGWRKYWHEKIN